MSSTLRPVGLVESIAIEFAQLGRDRQVQICGFSSPELPQEIIGDDVKAAHVLRALTQLAIQRVAHTKDGAVVIELLTDKELHQDQVRFAVSDSRTDLSLDEMLTLTTEGEQQLTPGGAVSQLLTEMGTKLQPDVELLGRATRLYFSMPLLRAGSRLSESTLSEHLSGMRMFLVANDPVPNRVIQHYCRYAGIDVQGAPTAAETIVELSRAESASQHFAIVAVAPPIEDLSAIQLAQTIRDSDLAYLKLLYVAPWDDPVDRLAHMSAGFDATLAKPFLKQQLFETLEQLAGRIPKKVNEKPIILVVEDNPINARIAVFQARLLGYEAHVASNGEEALKELEHANYVAILMDLQMPVMDGFEATRAIRERESVGKTARTPIIALTANIEWEETAMNAGCDFFLTKPATKEGLKAALNHCRVVVGTK